MRTKGIAGRNAAWFLPIAVALVVQCAGAVALSIPEDQVDKKKVYCGACCNFEKAGEVNVKEVIKATPEYIEIKKKKIKRGTGKFWILMSHASDRTVRAISQVGKETDYDLITAKGYLGGLNPPIKADDITGLVIEKMVGVKKSGPKKPGQGPGDKPQEPAEPPKAPSDKETSGEQKAE